MKIKCLYYAVLLVQYHISATLGSFKAVLICYLLLTYWLTYSITYLIRRTTRRVRVRIMNSIDHYPYWPSYSLLLAWLIAPLIPNPTPIDFTSSFPPSSSPPISPSPFFFSSFFFLFFS